MTIEKILIVDDEEEIREVMVMMIETIGQYKILEASSGNSAIEVLKKDQNIGLVFCDYRMNDGNGGDVYQWIHTHMPKLPFVLVSTAEPRDIDALRNLFEHNPLNDHIVKPFDDDMLRKSIERVFLRPDDLRKNQINEKLSFCQIKIEEFLKYQIACKVFIKINDEKFIKIREEDDSGTDLITKYLSKGMEDVYLIKSDYQAFLKDRMLVVNAERDAISSIEFTREVIRNLGIQEITIQQIDQALETVEEEISDQVELVKFLDRFKGKRSYIADHALLTAYLSSAVAKYMTWNSTTIYKKLIFASLFKDISLEQDGHAKIMDLKSRAFFEFDLDTQTLIKNHMYISAQYFERLQSISDDVRNLLLTHHERPDGTGFPRGMDSAHLSPLEALFILTLNYAHELITNDCNNLKTNQWLKANEKIWNAGNFKRPYQNLLKILGQKE